MKFINTNKNASILSILSSITFLIITAQIIFFTIHYKVSDIFDSFVQSTLSEQFFHAVVILPLLGFLVIQLLAYTLFVAWTWFVATSISEFVNLSRPSRFGLSLFILFINCGSVLCLNNDYFPDSLFAELIPTSYFMLLIFTYASALSALIAYFNALIYRRHVGLALGFALLVGLVYFFNLYWAHIINKPHLTQKNDKPNVIIISVDSVRPDYVSYLNSQSVPTPSFDAFLDDATIFTESYTPLARTFTSWMSLLTAQHPKNSNARSNLTDPTYIHAKTNLAKTLQTEGYETIYASDEKRFSNMTRDYGFDRLLGPKAGINDFILGGLNDFPLTNLLINTSVGSILFPYNYGNRAAAITYDPNKFLQQIKIGLAKRSDKPLFLAIHLCLSHWPFTWARDKQAPNFTISQRYQSSITELDKQFAKLMQVLKTNNLLDHSVVVLLSDHGTTIGLPNDRIINKNLYEGSLNKTKALVTYKLASAPIDSLDIAHDYTLNTSYGQGTDVLSLKQYHTLLAFKGFGIETLSRKVTRPVTLMDVSPTLLSLLKLEPFQKSDGESLKSYLVKKSIPRSSPKPLFIETGHSFSEIETSDIFVNKVVKNAIGLYQINPKTGYLSIKHDAEKSMLQSKQRAIVLGNWLLARYPAATRSKLVPKTTGSSNQDKTWVFEKHKVPAFYVLVNLKTKKWGIGLDSPIAKKAPTEKLKQLFDDFYGNEIKNEV